LFSALLGPFGSTLGAPNTAGGSPPVITTVSLPGGTVGSAYSQTLTATGTAPITWSITSGSISPLTLNSSTGAITGTPSTATTLSATFRATNAFGFDEDPLSIVVSAASTPMVITRLTLPNGTVGAAYNEAIAYTGSTPATWSVYDGVLPTGLTLNTSTGVISGTPSTGSSTQFIIRATNAFTGYNDDRNLVAYAVRVNPFVVAPYLIENAIPDCHTTIPYSQTFSATGDAPFTWSLSGTLPTGLSFNTSTATLSGTPTSTGTFSLSVSVSNSSGTSTKTISLKSEAFSSNRIYGKDLTWIGAIRLPQTSPQLDAYKGGCKISVDSSQSIFYMGVGRNSTASAPGLPVIKMTLPAIVNSTNKNSLNTASFIGSYFDSSEGGYTQIDAGASETANINSVYYNSGYDKLYVSASYFYLTTDAKPAIYSRSGSLVTNGSVSGIAKINSRSRFYNNGSDATSATGVSAGIPEISFGGSDGSIVTMLSLGPSLFAFNNSSLTTGTTNVAGTALLGYSTSLSTLYSWNPNQQNPYYQDGVTQFNGIAWLQSKPVFLAFGSTGLGQVWYGGKTAGGALVVQPGILSTVPGQTGVGVGSEKGNQGPPYHPYVWAYDEQDLIDVKNGTKLPGNVKPYDVWKLNIPVEYFPEAYLYQSPGPGGYITGVSHDLANKRIYVVQKAGDSFTADFQTIYLPLIHVYSYP